MKRIYLVILLLAMVLYGAQALCELGFAEIAKENVNVRQAPGEKTLWQMDSPQSVYVFEEKTVGQHLWCHVSTYVGKNPKTGWIRGDMLRFLSDEFYDIVDISMANTYLVGLRRDQTVAIMGDDMPHAPCVEAARRLSNVAQVRTCTCAVFALKTNGTVVSIGKDDHFDGMQADVIGSDFPYPMDRDGRFLHDEWEMAWSNEIGCDLGDETFVSILGEGSSIDAALTKTGEVRCYGAYAGCEAQFNDGPYVDLAWSYSHLAAVNDRGRVSYAEAAIGSHAPCLVEGIETWENVVRVDVDSTYEYGTYMLGLRADGKVYYAGGDKKMARQVAQWENVVDIAAGLDACAALLKDGTVVMAGHVHEGYFR